MSTGTSGLVYGIQIRIQIHKAAEYGSNLDPDPQHDFYLNTCYKNLLSPTNL